MDVQRLADICEWLKASTIGIIILGAIGSIVGAIVLVIGRRLMRFLVPRIGRSIARGGRSFGFIVISSLARRYLISDVIARRLRRSGDSSMFVGFYLTSLVALMFSLGAFLVLLLTSILVVSLKGSDHPILSAGLVAFTILWFMGFVMDAAAFGAVYSLMPSTRYELKLKRRYKDRKVVMAQCTREFARAPVR